MRKWALVACVGVLFTIGAGYHYFFGYVEALKVDERITILHRKNLLRQIGANVVVYDDIEEALVIDAQLKPVASATRLIAQEITANPISKLFITHWHPDHSGGIAAYANDVSVYAHVNVTRLLSSVQRGFGLTSPESYHEFPPRPPSALPNVAVEGQLHLDLPGTTVRVRHFPNAHTNGDIVVFIGVSRTAVLGDMVWPGAFPYIDVINGGSVSGLERALRDIVKQTEAPYHFITGHGDTVLSYGDVVDYLEMIQTTREWVERQLDEGHGIDHIVNRGLPERWGQFSSSLVPTKSWITMIYETR